jgi:hypothetical protein
MSNIDGFEWLGNRLRQSAVCIRENINMTPYSPPSSADEAAKQLYQQEKELAEAACSRCDVNPECYVYSIDIKAGGILANALDKATRNKLAAIYRKEGLSGAVDYIRLTDNGN